MIAPVEPFRPSAPGRATRDASGAGSAPAGATGGGAGSTPFRERVAKAVASRAEGVRVSSESDPLAPVRVLGSDTSPIREGRPASALAFALSAYMEELDASEPDWVEDRSPRDWVEANVDPEVLVASPRF